MYAEQSTQFDLRWTMFGIHVRVQPLFWLVALVMGWPLLNASEDGIQRLLLWVAVLFVSILVHELGHVCMGRYFGAHGDILIYGFGGLAIGSSNLPHRGQRIAVYLAGPGAGFLLVALLVLGLFLYKPAMVPLVGQNVLALLGLAPHAGFPELTDIVAGVLEEALWINVFWGFINLLPVWPLDGGQVARDVGTGVSPRNGARVALAFSIALAALLAIHAFSTVRFNRPLIPYLENVSGYFVAILFALLALEGYQELQREQARASLWDRDRDDYPWR